MPAGPQVKSGASRHGILYADPAPSDDHHGPFPIPALVLETRSQPAAFILQSGSHMVVQKEKCAQAARGLEASHGLRAIVGLPGGQSCALLFHAVVATGPRINDEREFAVPYGDVQRVPMPMGGHGPKPEQRGIHPQLPPVVFIGRHPAVRSHPPS